MTRPSVRVYEDLRRRILSGAYAPGDWLREGSVAAALEVSRTPVRDALQRLQADGLVTLHPNRGAQVTEFASGDLDDIFNVRALLEGYAARLAAENDRSQAVVEELRTLCEAMEEAAAGGAEDAEDRITELNLEFHRAVHQAAGNALLPGMLSTVIEISRVRNTFHIYSPREMERSLHQHRELVEAIAAGDGMWAQSVMQSHVLSARTALTRYMESQQQG
ncbi:GntR family transcriptional regulator [Streptomyces sp. NPDC057611]|uniref:GntR family transcriptional regulator n=1 Tax=unclassified Streptomyces TaxID=2593676 RepID=UPI0035D5E9D1